MSDIAELKTLMLSMHGDVKDTKASVNNITEDIKIFKKSDEEIKKELLEYKSKCSSLEGKCENLEKEVGLLKNKLKYLEVKERFKNIIIYNVDDNENNNLNLRETIIKIFKQVEICNPAESFERITRLGRIVGSRPILISFNFSSHVREVFTHVNALRSMNISVSNDYTPEQREIRKELKNFQKKLIEEGKSSKIRGVGLLIENKYYTLQTLQKMFHEKEIENFHSDGEESTTSHSSTSSRKRTRTPKADIDKKNKLKKTKEIKDNSSLKSFFLEKPSSSNSVKTT